MKRIAILGAGNIARKMAQTINMMTARGDAVQLYAVASRDQQKSDAFAAEFHAAKAYGDYEAMLSDPQVDLVYVATPHALHADQVKACLRHGKPVLCEKAFTGNARQAQEVLAMSEELGILVAEAIWPRYMPSRKMIDDVIASGRIGEVKLLTANLGYDIDEVPRIRLPELAGGALLDLGVYTLNFAAMVLGTAVTGMKSTVTMLPTGCDLEEDVVLTYANGVTAHLMNTAVCSTDRHGVIYGTKGYLVADNVNSPMRLEIYNLNHELVETLHAPQWLTGFEYQVEACLRALDNGWYECPEMPHAEILRVMQQMDELRAQWGMVYPFD